MRASMFRASCPSIAFTPGLVGLLLVSVEFFRAAIDDLMGLFHQ